MTSGRSFHSWRRRTRAAPGQHPRQGEASSIHCHIGRNTTNHARTLPPPTRAATTQYTARLRRTHETDLIASKCICMSVCSDRTALHCTPPCLKRFHRRYRAGIAATCRPWLHRLAQFCPDPLTNESNKSSLSPLRRCLVSLVSQSPSLLPWKACSVVYPETFFFSHTPHSACATPLPLLT